MQTIKTIGIKIRDIQNTPLAKWIICMTNQARNARTEIAIMKIASTIPLSFFE